MTQQPTLAAPAPITIRQELEDLVIHELLGPAGGPEELIAESNVRDRYLVGMLAPANQTIEPEEVDDNDRGVVSGDDSAADPGVFQRRSMFPSTIGLTCCITGDVERVAVRAAWGRYIRVPNEDRDPESKGPSHLWKRQPMGGTAHTLRLVPGKTEWAADAEQDDVTIQAIIRKRDGAWIVSIFLLNRQRPSKKAGDQYWIFQPELAIFAPDQAAIFRQRAFLPERNVSDTVALAEDCALRMRHRNHVEFAVGHGVGVHAVVAERDATQATMIVTSVIPRATVPATTEPTAEDAPALAELSVDMRDLAEPSELPFAVRLQPLIDAYSDWIEQQAVRIDDPAARLSDYRDEAQSTIADCRRALERVRAGIAMLDSDPLAAEAFRFANRAMWLQRIHGIFAESKRRGEKVALAQIDQPRNRSWRVFQLAFILLNLPALTDLGHAERSTDINALADLLWYPTGGGKTEAYLGLTAYALGIRRLQGEVAGRSGLEGVAVIMRYTLRLLTLQQFQRATALICACEQIRQDAIRGGDTRWGSTPFRIGLWVGQRTTPNTTEESQQSIARDRHQDTRPSTSNFGGSGSPLQLTNCPWCGTKISAGQHVQARKIVDRTFIYCGDPMGDCPFSERQSPNEGLPVLVVDDEIYRWLPALLIATVDKFAQLPWKGRTQMLFGQVDGYCGRHGFRSPDFPDETMHVAVPRERLPAVKVVECGPLRPPDLIIQDELHLISGPLGSLVGLYESAIDKLCTWEVNGRSVRPKVIASTATVRRADQQMHALFLRRVSIFPPTGLDAEDNFFAIQRPITPETPGRRYLGICAIGKRQKAVMIRLSTALMASAQLLFNRYGASVDPWMTLVGYFNAMRDLGSARRLFDDDIRTRLWRMEERGLGQRQGPMIEELTSRKSSGDIPEILDRLELPFRVPVPAPKPSKHDKPSKSKPVPKPLDVLLATNMIAVGVDVKRLGLMLVNGQPKTTSEYIQATSRVGRSTPGLVCTILNWSRPRDLSHYEQFEHYHATFYQHVEALTVTPFAARARDRALSALMVALTRLGGLTYVENGAASALQRTDPLIEDAIAYIIERAGLVAGSTEVADQVRAELEKRRDQWLNEIGDRAANEQLGYQRMRDGRTVQLLKRPEEGEWDLFTCLNSLRDVEGTSRLLLNDAMDERGNVPAWQPAIPSTKD